MPLPSGGKRGRPLIEDGRAGILLARLSVLNGDMEIAESVADGNALLAKASDMIPT